uniref:DNA repair and recombination protein RAD54B n=1 Tax=Rhizochromulina marina TaxID=1034831 RepID=A0A7S2W8P1_9STRA|mmetsp:Transcript_1734/g.5114  ORF Transcript_1734/g.5114 Transcript_1734/m.5114 type:complete len:917 (+) Transcript_1734:91-2841(+)
MRRVALQPLLSANGGRKKRKFQVPVASGQKASRVGVQDRAPPPLPRGSSTGAAVPAASAPLASSLSFAVLYAKPGAKKRKTFLDGHLHCMQGGAGPGGATIRLSDAQGAVLATERSGAAIRRALEAGAEEIEVNRYQVQIVQRIQGGASKVPGPAQGPEVEPQGATPRARVAMAPPARRTNAGAATSSGTSGGGTSRRADPLAEQVQDPGIRTIRRLLKPHQAEAVRFMWQCIGGDPHQKPHHPSEESVPLEGAILADDMGLGKTLSSIALVYSCLHYRLCSKAVVVCPSSLVDNWQNEFAKFLRLFLSRHAGSPHRRVLALKPGKEAETVVKEFLEMPPPVLILSYESYRKFAPALNRSPLSSTANAAVGLMICDEGHRLKSSGGNKTMQALQGCPSTKRILLSGTPVQNNLAELHAMASFVRPGALGSAGEFRREYGTAIEAGRDRDADTEAQAAGQRAAEALRQMLDTFVLRRTAEDIANPTLPPRQDLTLFIRLNERQAKLYQSVLGEHEASVCVHTGAVTCSDPLRAIHRLRTLCNHPALFDQCSEGSMISRSAAPWPQTEEFLRASAKLACLDQVLTAVRAQDPRERVVLVSNFTTALDLFEAMADHHGWQYVRLDGSTPQQERQALVDRCNRRVPGDNLFLFLLSSHAGGVGLNLVGASRLVLFDTDWNPAVDKQVMARVWRNGQRRPVFIYRLLCTGTIEEKMYQRQLSKDELSCAVEDAGGPSQGRFSQDELRDLLTLNASSNCETFDRMGGQWAPYRGHTSVAGIDPALCSALVQAEQGLVSFVHVHEKVVAGQRPSKEGSGSPVLPGGLEEGAGEGQPQGKPKDIRKGSRSRDACPSSSTRAAGKLNKLRHLDSESESGEEDDGPDSDDDGEEDDPEVGESDDGDGSEYRDEEGKVLGLEDSDSE